MKEVGAGKWVQAEIAGGIELQMSGGDGSDYRSAEWDGVAAMCNTGKIKEMLSCSCCKELKFAATVRRA
ncbi:hypothetical protein C5167_033251 [Papaver somniferum]|uniref:Uncharacterized protein n=1 Tax=Papaver somniferum TaxID=3469 RepID=A0A4Y7K9T2_PAPSO|nr:hypothetical protein C5167_033251 [Papaver somniferum]